MLYIHLYNGRRTMDEQMQDWGDDGPTFGPYKSMITTYGSHVRLFPKDGHEGFYEHEFCITDGLIYYNGMYYGDWEVYSAREPADELHIFDQNKTRMRVEDV